jgi:autotransporter-associated beta strand protein
MKSFRPLAAPSRAGYSPFTAAVLCSLAFLFSWGTACAASGTWLANPVDNNWNNPANWSTGTVPGGDETATLGTSSITSLVVPLYSFVGTIEFTPGASAYTITFTLTGQTNYFFWFIGGSGIDNKSGILQNFILPAPVNQFGDGAIVDFFDGTAGDLVSFTCQPNPVTTGRSTAVSFGRSGCGSATFHNLGATTPGGFSGVTEFAGVGASADQATIINEGGTVSGAPGGQTIFDAYEGGRSTADNATLIANAGTNGGGGGTVQFYSHCEGGTARLELFGNGYLDIGSADTGFTIGSLEGDGQVYLGSKSLSIGSNNLSTTFAGVLHPGGPAGGSGKGGLTKIGTGTLTLSGANTYTGVTTVSTGMLRASNGSGSATGTGAVNVNAGTLSGKGSLSGTVTIGTGSGPGAFLAPSAGVTKATTLTIGSPITFNGDSTYTYRLTTKRVDADKVLANGVTIASGAQFSFNQLGNRPLPAGTVFTAISNTAATPIVGTFANLPDGSIFTVGRNTYQADYQGGDDNDLTLTVLP